MGYFVEYLDRNVCGEGCAQEVLVVNENFVFELYYCKIFSYVFFVLKM